MNTETARPRIREAELQEAVLELAGYLGYMVHHDRPARTATGWATPIQGDPGFPDLVLVHPRTGFVIFAELKSADGAVTGNQLKWLAALRGQATVWRPEDWTSGAIEAVLREGAQT